MRSWMEVDGGPRLLNRLDYVDMYAFVRRIIDMHAREHLPFLYRPGSPIQLAI